jgi:iron complex outermembrane recepter protein
MKTLRETFLFVTCSALLFLFAGMSPLSAQVVVDDSLKVQLDEIRVEAAYSSVSIGEAPMSLSYMMRSRADITSRPAATMDELTFSLPGIYISNRENYALGERLTIRGLGWRAQFGVRGSQVILDDIPLTVADGQTIMNMIDPATVERIELLRGPSATFWGNSSGGVLFLSTKPAPDAPTIQYRGYAGSFNTVKQELRFNTRAGGTRLYGYGTFFDTEGFREHSAARLFRGSIGAERALSENGYLSFRAMYASMPKAQHPGSLNSENARENPSSANPFFANNFAGKTFEQAMVALSYLHSYQPGTLTLSANGTWRDLNNPLPFGYVGLDRYAGTLRSVFQFDDLPVDLHVGGELKIQQDDRLETNIVDGQRGDEIRVDQVETVTNQALFARTGLPLGDRLLLSFGLRADWLQFRSVDDLGQEQEGDRSFFSLNPSAGFTYRLDNARIYANFSTSFESPTTVELVNRPEGGNGFNQNLNPERTISVETGIRGQLNRIDYDFAVYAMRVNDLITSFQLEEGGPNFFRNEGNSLHYGFESGLGYSFSDNLNLRLMLNLLRAEFESGDIEGNEIPGVAPFRFGGTFKFTPGNHAFSVDNEWVGRYFADSANTTRNSAYSIFNARWSVTLSEIFNNVTIRPFVSVQNIFNSRYNTSVAINNAGGLFFEPGTDRNFRAGLQVDFF